MMSGLDVEFPVAKIPFRSTYNGGACDGKFFMFLWLCLSVFAPKHTLYDQGPADFTYSRVPGFFTRKMNTSILTRLLLCQ